VDTRITVRGYLDIHQYTAAVTLDVTRIVKPASGFQKKCRVPVTITGNEITQTILIPIADRDRRTLTSGEW
jgi:hypothetical protein